ncbi:hypothetical protein PR048_030410 [Dryococelus australis]|uniref:Uncharacterized protein n=1 Tax=Dryococelus australis TaxID=614101 RepID=A0ABQ9G8W8_9NEOP|nr:hypothetical protein PR048_030410 [Dryococelus australis]
MRAIDTGMEQRRNAGAGETGDPQENPPTNGITRHDLHMRKSSGVTRPGIEPRSPWWEASRLTARPPSPLKLLTVFGYFYHGASTNQSTLEIDLGNDGAGLSTALDDKLQQFISQCGGFSSLDPKQPKHLRDRLDRRVRRLSTLPRILQQLWDELQAAWLQIPVETYQYLTEPLPARLAAVLAFRSAFDVKGRQIRRYSKILGSSCGIRDIDADAGDSEREEKVWYAQPEVMRFSPKPALGERRDNMRGTDKPGRNCRADIVRELRQSLITCHTRGTPNQCSKAENEEVKRPLVARTRAAHAAKMAALVSNTSAGRRSPISDWLRARLLQDVAGPGTATYKCAVTRRDSRDRKNTLPVVAVEKEEEKSRWQMGTDEITMLAPVSAHTTADETPGGLAIPGTLQSFVRNGEGR